MTSTALQPGDVLAGKYRVERVMGQGNMGVVVAAFHMDLAQRVALKLMLPSAAAQKEHRERFLREARASVRLKSQHVTRVLDVGTAEGDTPYIVMELLEGADLAATISKNGPLSFASAVHYLFQACEAVSEAHAAGIVHRDLKPANLFLTHDVGGSPCVKVLDFGISKSTGMDLTLTQDAQALGSPLYMSPEQMSSSKDVDPRSDIWALGIVLYQLVAGITPFHAESIQELCARVLMGSPTPLNELRPDAPPGFEAIILRCLERHREKRFQNVAELVVALSPYAPPSALVYVQRVSTVLGLPVPPAVSVSSLPSTSGSYSGLPSAPRDPGVAASSAGFLGHSAPAAGAIGPGTVVMASPTAGGSPAHSGSAAQSGSASLVVTGGIAAETAAGANLAMGASTATSLSASGTGLAASQNSASPAPSSSTGAFKLALAAAGGALLLLVVGGLVLKPWNQTSGPAREPASVNAGSVEVPPAVVPATATSSDSSAASVPAVPVSAQPAPTDVPTAKPTAKTPSQTPSSTPKASGSVKPSGKIPSPGSKPGVSYDERR